MGSLWHPRQAPLKLKYEESIVPFALDWMTMGMGDAHDTPIASRHYIRQGINQGEE